MGPNSSDSRRARFMINECGKSGHKIYSRKNIKKHKHFCYESQVQSMPGAKMGGSFVSPHGGYVGGWRKIHMIMTAQVKKDCHQKT